jgi:hypothetical protein
MSSTLTQCPVQAPVRQKPSSATRWRTRLRALDEARWAGAALVPFLVVLPLNGAPA